MKNSIGIIPIFLIVTVFMFSACFGDSNKPGGTSVADSAKAITSFTFPESTSTAINETAHTIAVTVPYGTVVTALVPTISYTGASINPASGAANDFSSSKTYTVTAADSSTQEYIVSVTVSASDAKAITSFTFPESTSTAINETAHTIAVTVPYGTVVTALVPTISYTGASINPASGAANDFSSSKTYTVTAADSSKQEYIVSVTVSLSGAKAITSFTFPESTSTIINETAHTIAVTVPYGTVVTALVPTISHTGVSINPASGVANDFSSSKTYTVTAADSSTQEYVVTVAASTLTYVLPGGISFNLKNVPGGTFPTSSGSQTRPTDVDAKPATVSASFWMAETETTREVWNAVYRWGTGDIDMNGVIDNGETAGAYVLSNPGDAGDGTSESNQHPIATVNWRDTMVWCNALTEYFNAHNGSDPDLDCVYYSDSDYTEPIRTSTNSETRTWESGAGINDGTQDDPYIKASADGNTDMSNCTAKGFRLPGINEWECAARYIDGVNWTAGTFASGAIADYTNVAETAVVAVFAVHSSAVVKSKKANALGIYDMSGNVWEWCFDWYPQFEGSNRYLASGGWDYTSGYMQVGNPSRYSPYGEFDCFGFRFVRSK